MDALLKKLQHKGSPLTVVDPPAELEPVIASWAEGGVEIKRKLARSSSFTLVFVRSCADVEKIAPKVVDSLDGGDPILWMAYPKKSSKRYASDLGRDDSWQALGDLGFEPVRQVAIDDDWSALRFRRAEAIKSLTRSRALSETGKARLSERPASTAQR